MNGRNGSAVGKRRNRFFAQLSGKLLGILLTIGNGITLIVENGDAGACIGRIADGNALQA